MCFLSFSLSLTHFRSRNDSTATATDDPTRIVTVTASDGKSGAERTISYTNCKVVGNGSFGVVFAARMLGEWSFDWGHFASSLTAVYVIPSRREAARWKYRPRI